MKLHPVNDNYHESGLSNISGAPPLSNKEPRRPCLLAFNGAAATFWASWHRLKRASKKIINRELRSLGIK